MLFLVDEKSNDPQLTSDLCAGARGEWAKATSNPDFSGHGNFTVDTMMQPGDFAGAVTNSSFVSTAPPTATSPVTMQIYLPVSLFANVPPSVVTLTGAQLQFSPKTGRGQLNGAVAETEIQGKLIPNVAATLDMNVQANPSSSNSKQILQIFDNGGTATAACGQTCQNPDLSCAVSGDGHISTCEVGTNSIIKNVLAPDVDLFDDNGNWAPNPQNTKKDSLSVGFGFTAVPAVF